MTETPLREGNARSDKAQIVTLRFGNYRARGRESSEKICGGMHFPSCANVALCYIHFIETEMKPMTTLVETQSLYVAIGGRKFPVATLAAASDLFCKTRDAFGEGASKTPRCKVIDQRGRVIGRISYNGRIWPDAEWFDGMVPLYDNR